MECADVLVGNTENKNTAYCFADAGQQYLVYLPEGGPCQLNLQGVTGRFEVAWFDPRNGGPLQSGSVTDVHGGSIASLGTPPQQPEDDWLATVRRVKP